jgi:hypothetical protein
MWDLSNQFVAEGEVGGLVTFVAFLAIISRSFGNLGRTRKQVGRRQQWLLWSLGAVMLADNFAFFGVSYWDQTQLWWFAFLAMISAATVALQAAPPKPESAEAEDGGVPEPKPDGNPWYANAYPMAV